MGHLDEDFSYDEIMLFEAIDFMRTMTCEYGCPLFPHLDHNALSMMGRIWQADPKSYCWLSPLEACVKAYMTVVRTCHPSIH